MEIRENVGLAGFTTFGVGGPARWFVNVRRTTELEEAMAWAESHGVRVFVLGGGSNLLVPDEGFDGLVLQMDIYGMDQDRSFSPQFMVGAGVPWDRFVNEAIDANCAGVECLAGIPGTVGGTPVQNVGAYGQEVSSTIDKVEAWDRERKEIVWLSNLQCGFGYRSSIFNTTAKERYIVTRVVFQLRYDEPTLTYAELASRFAGKKPSLREVAEAVRAIRRGKGMVIDKGDPDSKSAGSFFKNPVVTGEALQHIATAAGVETSAVPQWLAGSGKWKLPAAWLLERSGFVKGYGVGPVGISSKHTLALVNHGGATFADVMKMQEEIVAGVERKFGVRLEREPVVLGKQ